MTKHNHAARHKCTIGCTGQYPIGWSVNKSFHTSTYFLLFFPNFISHPCRASESLLPGPEESDIFCRYDPTAFPVMLTRIKKTRFVPMFLTWHRRGIFVQISSLQDICNGFVDSARTILCQFVGLQNSPLFLFSDKSDCLAQFLFHDDV